MVVDIEDERDVDRLEADYRAARPAEPLFYLVGVPWREIPRAPDEQTGRERAFCRLLRLVASDAPGTASDTRTLVIVTGADDEVQATGGYRFIRRLGVDRRAVDLSASWWRETTGGRLRDGRGVVDAVRQLVERDFAAARALNAALRAVLLRPGNFLVGDWPGAEFHRSASSWRGELNTGAMVDMVVDRAAAALALPPAPTRLYLEGPQLHALRREELLERMRGESDKRAIVLYCLSQAYRPDPSVPHEAPLVVEILRRLARVLRPDAPLWVQTPADEGRLTSLREFGASPWWYLKPHPTLVFANPFAAPHSIRR